MCTGAVDKIRSRVPLLDGESPELVNTDGPIFPDPLRKHVKKLRQNLPYLGLRVARPVGDFFRDVAQV